MNRFPCRCRKCGARRTLARRPEETANRCKCETCTELREQGRDAPLHCSCGGNFRVDWYRRGKEHLRAACYCEGYPWAIDNAPHRRGSPECFYANQETGAAAPYGGKLPEQADVSESRGGTETGWVAAHQRREAEALQVLDL